MITRIYNELKTDPTKISKKNFDQLKTFVEDVNNDGKKYSNHLLLYLIKKIQQASHQNQSIIIDHIVSIFEKFIIIEKCIKRYVPKPK